MSAPVSDISLFSKLVHIFFAIATNGDVQKAFGEIIALLKQTILTDAPTSNPPAA